MPVSIGDLTWASYYSLRITTSHQWLSSIIMVVKCPLCITQALRKSCFYRTMHNYRGVAKVFCRMHFHCTASQVLVAPSPFLTTCSYPLVSICCTCWHVFFAFEELHTWGQFSEPLALMCPCAHTSKSMDQWVEADQLLWHTRDLERWGFPFTEQLEFSGLEHLNTRVCVKHLKKEYYLWSRSRQLST